MRTKLPLIQLIRVFQVPRPERSRTELPLIQVIQASQVPSSIFERNHISTAQLKVTTSTIRQPNDFDHPLTTSTFRQPNEKQSPKP